MRIAIGSDHAGYRLKRRLLETLEHEGHQAIDLGTHDEQPVDYPDSAEAVGMAVLENQADRGIVICGSGVGASVAANKLPGIRAGLCHDLYSAQQGVEHDAMNVLVLGARVIATEAAIELTRAFLNATFSGEDRHVRRLAKIRDMETRLAGGHALIDNARKST